MAAKSTEKTKVSVVLDSIEFLLGNKLPDTPEGYESPSEVVVPRVAFSIGPDEFLRREVIEHLLVLMKFDSLAVTRFDGEEVKWADIHDELATRSLFDTGGPKCAFVRKADDFISKNRDSIEHWIEKGLLGSSAGWSSVNWRNWLCLPARVGKCPISVSMSWSGDGGHKPSGN